MNHSALNVQPVTLPGKIVRLEPISEKHVPDLAIAGNDENIWRYMVYGNINSEGKMLAWVHKVLDGQHAGTDLPFAVIHQPSGRAIGSTRYMEIRAKHRGLEIGGTWYAKEHQRTAVNTECKFLLLQHAFEVLGCIRVQLKTDVRNERSWRAIERLGAVREGVLRNHMLMPDGSIRQSVYYSILDSEWPGVKERLMEKLKT